VWFKTTCNFNKCTGTNWISICKRIKLTPDLITYAKTDLKWTTNLKLKANKRLIEENTNKSS
jgi:hypothetical protein